LKEHPTNFTKGKRGTRSRLVEKHRIVYRVENDTDDNATAGDVEIIRIWRPGQNRPFRL
jgi:Txe/YoeB family toxin of Txe-Axe toxin-antitoxin module